MATVKAFRKGFYLSLHTPDTESETFEHPNPDEIASWAKPVEAEITADSEVVVEAPTKGKGKKPAPAADPLV